MKLEIKNATIESVRISTGSGCVLTLDYGSGSTQQAMFRCCDLFRLMDVAGVKSLSELEGRAVRANVTPTEIEQIGHIVNEDWVTLS